MANFKKGEVVYHPKFGRCVVIDDKGDEVHVKTPNLKGDDYMVKSIALSYRPNRTPVNVVPFENTKSKQDPLKYVDAAMLSETFAPPRSEHVPGIIPANNVTLLMGDGGTGKSLVALQLAVATAMGIRWLGQDVNPGRVLFLTAEDELDEVHRRLEDISYGMQVEMADMKALVILSLAGREALLFVAEGRSGVLKPTPLFAQIEQWLRVHKPALVVLDTLADLFGGEENARSQARQFIAALRGLALTHQTTVLLLGHPSVSGMSSGTGTSGNTGWSNSVRSRLYFERVLTRDGDKPMEPDPDLRVLRLMKANYGRVGAEIRMRWTDGMFVPCDEPTGESGRLQGVRAERVFMDLLQAYTAEGRGVGPSPGPNYAPAIFSKDPRANGLSKGAFVAVMNRLFAEQRIRVETVGPPSRRIKTIVEWSPDASNSDD